MKEVMSTGEDLPKKTNDAESPIYTYHEEGEKSEQTGFQLIFPNNDPLSDSKPPFATFLGNGTPFMRDDERGITRHMMAEGFFRNISYSAFQWLNDNWLCVRDNNKALLHTHDAKSLPPEVDPHEIAAICEIIAEVEISKRELLHFLWDNNCPPEYYEHYTPPFSGAQD